MPGRKFTGSSTYRYGFNGKENDNEVVGTGEGTQDYGMRIYNPALGKFLSVDPLTKKYPELTPYQFASNTPIMAIDLDGLEKIDANYISQVFTGKAALYYEIVVYVKQPGSGGDRDPYEVNSSNSAGYDVGHTFVRLTKINSDKTKETVTLGFYPDGAVSVSQGILSTKGKIELNGGYKYNTKTSKIFTGKDKFDAIIETIKTAMVSDYDIEDYNCTDFAIECAKKAGLELPDTQADVQGHKVTNAGDLGEDLKIKNKSEGTEYNNKPGNAAGTSNSAISEEKKDE